jgi:FkbH-like protein
MYETESNRQEESQEQIPSEILSRFGELRDRIIRRTVLPWSEHCTECVWPTCYSSCELYEARADGRCRRFVHGMVRIDCPEALNSYLLKITFKRWAKLWTPGNIRLYTSSRARSFESRDRFIGGVLNEMPLPAPVRAMAIRKRYSLKKKLAHRSGRPGSLPSALLLECYNPGQEAIGLSLTIRSAVEAVTIPFQRLFELTPGFHRVCISYAEIAAIVNLRLPFNIELIPNHDSPAVTLIFGVMDFVQEKSVQRAAQRADHDNSRSKIKCVVWDLDNTLWDGILVEDGEEGLTLKPEIREIIQELDRRGILQSIASKNNHDEAWSVLQRLQLDEYLLTPQISWRPKSEAIQDIAHQLNIGLDSLLFVDDSEFELQQVAAAVPQIRTINAQRYREIQNLDECSMPVTAESRERRRMYQIETQRKEIASNFADDYLAFLRHCEIRLNLRPLSEENLERVHELTQRTNQMNFSGNRYDRDVLKTILATPWQDTYVLEAADRFGSYGIVGFCIVDSRKPLITDLMFSCRIQSKRIEHAFLAWLIRKYLGTKGDEVWADYRQTSRNAPSGRVFVDIGMREVANSAGVTRLVFRRDQDIPDDDVVRITERSSSSIEC